MTEVVLTEAKIPDDIARSVMLPGAYAHEQTDSYPAMTWLRENLPFGLAELEGFDRTWLATKHADIMEIERNADPFSSAITDPFLVDTAGRAYLKEANNGQRTQDTMAYMDAPEHTKMKNIAVSWFMPASVRKREDAIRQLAKQSVDDLMANPAGDTIDVVKDFALHYPLRVLMTLFGIPQEDEDLMLRLTQGLFGAADEETKRDDIEAGEGSDAKAWKATMEDFYRYFDDLSADRRARPTDDLASVIANGKLDGELLPQSFINGYYLSIVTAGHDTTSSSISGALEQFACHPDQYAALRADHSLIPSAIEEAFRWVSPVKHFLRTLTRDTEFRGQRLLAGDSVMLLYPSGNRDADAFDKPDEFDLTRKPNKHVAFGFGPHQCIGQHVSRFEMRILMEELVPRLGKIELVDEPTFVAGNFISGAKSLRVKITPA